MLKTTTFEAKWLAAIRGDGPAGQVSVRASHVALIATEWIDMQETLRALETVVEPDSHAADLIADVLGRKEDTDAQVEAKALSREHGHYLRGRES